MLKRKLNNAGFASQILLLLLMPCGSYLKGQEPQFAKHQLAGVLHTNNVDRNASDTGQLLIALASETSTSEHSGKIMAEAPKIALNPKAKQFVAGYLKSNDEALVKVKKRSPPVFKIIDAIFIKNNLPPELKYLAVIESDLKTSAVSPVGAVGPWQLMPGTARSLGLKVSGKYDERKQYYKSTVAVAKYLKDLYAQFDDWLLVIAAYNGGPGTVYKAIKKTGSRNFWQLQYALPAETRAHVKRFIGAHYYFEDRGSETTLTKNEVTAFRKKMEVFIASQLANEIENKQKEQANEKQVVAADATVL